MNDLKERHMPAVKGQAQSRRKRNVANKDPATSEKRGHGWKPMCFKTYDQYKDYIHLMRQSGNPKDDGVCLDCTPEFKAEMMECGKCEHPETRFVFWKNETEGEVEMVGIGSDSRYWRRIQRGVTILNWGQDEDDTVPLDVEEMIGANKQ